MYWKFKFSTSLFHGISKSFSLLNTTHVREHCSLTCFLGSLPLNSPCSISLLSSFLKLYTTMPVAKLAGFLDMTEQEFRIQLLVFKHKMKNLVWTSGISALDGEFQSASEVDFYIDKVCALCVCETEPTHVILETV